MTPARRAALYARVSTRKGQSTDLQFDELRRAAEQRRWTIVHEYADEGVSGAKQSRPQLDRLMTDARRGMFDIVAVWKADRLARSLKHLITTIDDLSAMGIGFASITEPFDTTIPSGKLLLNVIGAMAQFERELLGERTRAGIDAARRRGAKIGRPRVAVDHHRALELRAAGRSIRQIAQDLGVSVGTVHKVLKKACSSNALDAGPDIPAQAAVIASPEVTL